MERLPAVSGFFYPSDGERLSDLMKSIEDKVEDRPSCDNPIGIIVPHAGMVYSGITAMHSYKAIRNISTKRFIIVGPNHHSYPPYAAVYGEGNWVTPLGRVRVDDQLGKKFAGLSDEIKLDNQPHLVEHSVEVQIPFLQHVFGQNIEICPIILGDQSERSAKGIARILEENSEDALFIISSDLTHYESDTSAMKKDTALISAIESLDVDRFYNTVAERRISACGYGAIAIMMIITKKRGGTLRLLDYRTSGDTGGDRSSVVGYVSMVACPP